MEFDATFFIAVISFIAFVFIMNRIFYAPILKIMQERQKLVEDNYINSQILKDETQKQLKYREEELEKSRNEVQQKIALNTQQLKRERADVISSYKSELFNNIAVEKENLKNSAYEAKEIINNNIVDIAKEISNKLLGSDINPEFINKSQIKEEQV